MQAAVDGCEPSHQLTRLFPIQLRQFVYGQSPELQLIDTPATKIRDEGNAYEPDNVRDSRAPVSWQLMMFAPEAEFPRA